MKKILALFMGVFMLTACNSENQTFKGYEYKMLGTPENIEATLGFDKAENKFFGAVVNRYFGSYEVDGDKITFGPAASTMMMGPEDAMNVEFELFQAFPVIKTFKLDGKKLIFTSDDGKEIVFEKIGEVEAQSK